MGNKEDKLKELKQGQKIAFIATFVTLLLAFIKAVTGYLFESKILVADAFHSGADLLAIFASGFGLLIASKEKTTKFPYGMYKAETLGNFIIGILIVWAGIEMLIDGYHKFFHIVQVQKFPILPVCVSIISIITSYFLAKKEKSIGVLIGSQSLLANANESFLDIFTSFVVLIGILLAHAQIPYVEGSIIICISLLILKLGLVNIWIPLLVLMDANLDPELQSEIEEHINKIDGVRGVGEVKIRHSGPFKIVECKIETSPSLPLYRTHELADKTENFILKNYEHIESVFIHVEPLKEEIIYAAIPVKDKNGLNSLVYGHFGRAPYFIIVKLSNNSVEIQNYHTNKFVGEKQHIGVKIIKDIIKYKINVLFTSQIGEIAFYMLKDNFVEIYKTEEGVSVKEIIEKYRNKKIESITMPTHPVEESQIQMEKK
ncbi:MAG: cation diffusion facilitator family transporter [Thermodesulfobacteriota bacterium]|nr:cation diffusion facilitator family transporter [Thermodesulfobacteriota bacterium]